MRGMDVPAYVLPLNPEGEIRLVIRIYFVGVLCVLVTGVFLNTVQETKGV